MSNFNKTFIIQPIVTLTEDSFLSGVTFDNNSIYYNMSDAPSAFTTNLNSLVVNLEGYTESGTTNGGDLLVTLGNHEALTGATKITINDTTKNIKFTGDRITYFTNDVPIVDTAIFHKQTQNKSGFYVNTLTELEKSGGTGTYLGEYKIVNNTSNDNESGTIGRRVDVSKGGVMNAQLLYGDFIDVSHDGGGRTDFMIGQPMNVIVNGTNSTNSIGIMRGNSINVEITNPNAVVDVFQGMHPSLNLTAGEVGTAQVLFLDIDKNNQINITGDISYIEANDDAMGSLTVGGKKRFIKYLGNLESDFNGIINTNVDVSVIESGTSKILTTKEWVTGYTNTITQRQGFAAVQSTQVINATTWTTVTFLDSYENIGNNWNGTIYTAPEDGMYEINGAFVFTSVNDGNIFIIGVQVNSDNNRWILNRGTVGGTGVAGGGGALKIFLNANDQVNMSVYCGNNTIGLGTPANSNYCTFSVYKML